MKRTRMSRTEVAVIRPPWYMAIVVEVRLRSWGREEPEMLHEQQWSTPSVEAKSFTSFLRLSCSTFFLFDQLMDFVFHFYQFESSIALQNIELEIDGAVWRELMLLLQVILLKSFNPVTSNLCDIQWLERKKFSQNFSVAWCSAFFGLVYALQTWN